MANATIRYEADQGDTIHDNVAQASDTTDIGTNAVRVLVNEQVGTKQEALAALDAIRQRIFENNWPVS